MKRAMNNQINPDMSLNNVMIQPLSEHEEQTIQKEIDMWVQSLNFSPKPQLLLRELANRFTHWCNEYEQEMTHYSIEMKRLPRMDSEIIKDKFAEIIHYAGRNIYFTEQIKSNLQNKRVFNIDNIEYSLDKKNMEKFLTNCDTTQNKLKEIISNCLQKYHQVDKNTVEKQSLIHSVIPNIH